MDLKKSIIVLSIIILLFLIVLYNKNKNEYKYNDNIIYEIGIEYGSESTPLRWIKIDEDKNDKNKILLITEKIVAYEKIKENRKDGGHYKYSKIRYFLNNEFYKKVFNIEERKKIIDTNITTQIVNHTFEPEKLITEESVDKLFILSKEEYDKYKLDAKLETTKYVDRLNDGYKGTMWLRNFKDYLGNKSALFLNKEGNSSSTDVSLFNLVRVAMWYDLSNNNNISDDDFIKKENKFIDDIRLDYQKGIYESFNTQDLEENIFIFGDNIEFDFNKNLNDNLNKNLNINENDIEYINFGTYKNKINWKCVYADDESVMLITKNIVDMIELDYLSSELKDVLNTPYDYSTVRDFLNKEFLKDFTIEEKNSLLPIYNDDIVSIPSFEEIVKFRVSKDNLSYDSVIDKIYYNKNYLETYYIRDTYIYNDIPYLLSYTSDPYPFVNFMKPPINRRDVGKEEDIINYSGIRPIIKMKKDKFIELYSDYKIPKIQNNKISYLDEVSFGKYEQDGNIENGKEDIKWIVIANSNYKDKKYYYLMTKDMIDIIENLYEYRTLDDGSSVFYFENTFFIDIAFNEEEKNKLIPFFSKSNNIKNAYVDLLPDNLNHVLFGECNVAKKFSNKYDKIEPVIYNNINEYMKGFRPIILLSEEEVLKLKNEQTN